MNMRIKGDIPPDPFLGAADLLETEYELTKPVHVEVRESPDERTCAAHYDDRHVLTISRRAATSAMARELALHEFAHMARNEQAHPSHTQSTREALFLALAGESVEQRKLTHCYQIANHMKDIYADDITLSVAPATKLVGFLESRVAGAVSNRSAPPRQGSEPVDGADPEITAVNTAFALAIVERHDLVDADHHLYDFGRIADDDAPAIDVSAFKNRFRALGRNPSESTYRKALVDATRAYAASS